MKLPRRAYIFVSPTWQLHDDNFLVTRNGDSDKYSIICNNIL